MPRFDLNLLTALDALITERNVTRAAERLHVTQPTMSGMLQRLRYQFDDQLLVRNGRAMELTYFGLSLIEPVREALRGVDSLIRAEPSFDARTSTRTFSVMTSDYCTAIFMPRVIARLAVEAPNVRLEIQALNAPVERMLSGELDLCISTNHLNLLSKETGEDLLQSRHLFSDEFVCVVAKHHALTEQASLEDYLQHPHVGVQLAHDIDTIVCLSTRRHRPQYRPACTVAEFSMIPLIVARSPLVGIVQKRLAETAALSLQIRSFVPPFEIPSINETLIWHPRHSEEPSHAWLRQLMFEEAQAWLLEGDRPVDGPELRLAYDGTPGTVKLRAVG